jgi:hypothetical protein
MLRYDECFGVKMERVLLYTCHSFWELGCYEMISPIFQSNKVKIMLRLFGCSNYSEFWFWPSRIERA